MNQKIELKLSEEYQNKILCAVTKWMSDHGYPSGEIIAQNDECTIDSVDLLCELGDIYNEIYYNQDAFSEIDESDHPKVMTLEEFINHINDRS